MKLTFFRSSDISFIETAKELVSVIFYTLLLFSEETITL